MPEMATLHPPLSPPAAKSSGMQSVFCKRLKAEAIGVADTFVVDLVFNATGYTHADLPPHAVTIEFDGIPVRTLGLHGLLETRKTSRDEDRLDRQAIEHALAALREGGGSSGDS
ncbi:MAG: hypothetical protein WCF43_02195 [Steroidobacteraceae bacterium]